MTKLKPLPADVPVNMPDMPARLRLTSSAQLKALGDPLRERVLGILQQQPVTAKQVADRLGRSPGSIGYQLKLLEKAGLAKVVALRVSRGLVSRYYTRTARLFIVTAVPGQRANPCLRILVQAGDELGESLREQPDLKVTAALLRIKLPPARQRHYRERLEALQRDLQAEPINSKAPVFAINFALFEAPSFIQHKPVRSRKPV